MSPDVVDDLFEPSLPCEFLGADVMLVVDAVLLNLDPMVAEAASENVVPSDVILRRHEKLEAGFAVGGGHVEERIILQGTSDSCHESALQVWLSAERSKKLAERVKEGGMPLNSERAGEDMRPSCNRRKTGRTQV